MGKMKDLALQLEERGFPDGVYRDMLVSDALRIVNEDAVSLVKVNGRWAVGRMIHVDYTPVTHVIPVGVL
jgi:hypothetical protein